MVIERDDLGHYWLAIGGGGCFFQGMNDARVFVYRIDHEDRVVFANEAWFEFARENGAGTLQPEAVLGRPLWSFLCHQETRALFEMLLARIRREGRSVSLPYRCDSPTLRRFMELDLAPLPQGAVEFRSRTLRLEPREPVRLLEDGVPRSPALLRICSWCKKVAVPGEGWQEVEDAMRLLSLLDAPAIPRMTHGICEECSDKVLMALEDDAVPG